MKAGPGDAAGRARELRHRANAGEAGNGDIEEFDPERRCRHGFREIGPDTQKPDHQHRRQEDAAAKAERHLPAHRAAAGRSQIAGQSVDKVVGGQFSFRF